MFHSFFQFPSKVEVLILLFTFFQFYSVVSRDSKVDNFVSSLFFFLFIIIRSGHLAEIRWSVCMSRSHRSLCVLFSRTGAGLCIYHLFVWSNLDFLYISQWITLPTQSCLLLLLQTPCKFFTPILIVVLFLWRVNESKSSNVPKTVLSILADRNSTVIWMVYIVSLIQLL